MKHLATALTEIIERCYQGNRSTLAKLADVSPSTIGRFCAGEVEPTVDRLDVIAKLLSRSDRKQLLLAAARDRVPAQFQDEIFGDEDPASQILRAKLSPDLAAVIRYLESNAMNDELTAAYLRKIGEWVFNDKSARTTKEADERAREERAKLKVAEEETPYKAPKKRGDRPGT